MPVTTEREAPLVDASTFEKAMRAGPQSLDAFLQRLQLADVVKGTFELRLILDDAKTITVPGPSGAPLHVEIPRSPYGTELRIRVDVGAADHGAVVLRGATLSFDTPGRDTDPSKPALAKTAMPRITNPAALEGSAPSTWKDALIATAKNAVADVRVRGATIDAEGKIRLAGEVVVAGRDHKDLQELAEGKLPVVPTTLWPAGKASSTESAPATRKKREGTPLADALRFFAALAYGGSWQADLELAPGKDGAAGKVASHGTVKINRDLDVTAQASVVVEAGGQRSELAVDATNKSRVARGALEVRASQGATSTSIGVRWDKEGAVPEGLDVDKLLPVRLKPWPGPGAAPRVGTPAFAKRIAALLDESAPAVPSSKVELLATGDKVLERRLALLDKAGPGDTVLLQTFIFKDDVTGTKIIDALVAARERGAKVKVLLDAIGSVRDPAELLAGPAAARKLKERGVDVALFNVPGRPLVEAMPGAFEGVRRSVAHIRSADGKRLDDVLAAEGHANLAFVVKTIVDAKSPRELLDDPLRMLALTLAASRAGPELEAVKKALPKGALKHLSVLVAKELTDDVPDALRGLGRDHRKQLVVYGTRDGKPFADVNMGGNNIGDDYLLQPGSPLLDDEKHRGLHMWNDADLHIESTALAQQAVDEMKRTWAAARGGGAAIDDVPQAPAPVVVGTHMSTAPGPLLRLVQHHPHGVVGEHHEVGDDHYANVLLATLEGAGKGDVIGIENPYFLPLPALRDAMVAAARRGAQITIVTNGLAENNDNLHVARQSRRFILPALVAEPNIAVYETLADARPIHRKVFSVVTNEGNSIFSVGSHNLDHLSARINREMFVLGGTALEGKHGVDGVTAALVKDLRRDTMGDEARRVYPSSLQGTDLDALARDFLTSLLLPVL